jgi:hypothetical protein
MDKVIVGIDLGGTIVRAGVFDTEGRMLVVQEVPIEAARGPEFGLRKIQGLIEQVLAQSAAKSLSGIGIGATGPVDPIKGIINNPFTLPTWETFLLSIGCKMHFKLLSHWRMMQMRLRWVSTGRALGAMPNVSMPLRLGLA